MTATRPHSNTRYLAKLLPLIAALPLLLIAAESGDRPNSEDRVGLPVDYAQNLEQIRHTYLPKQDKVITAFANPEAASIKTLDQLPYPAGSIIVLEWADAQKDDAGQPRRDDAGAFLTGAVTRIDVMRRETGYGAGYGDDRAGEWEFASYRPGGGMMDLPEGAASCARCHQRAGAERDFVFAGRFPPKN